MINFSSPIIGKNWREILSIYTREKMAQDTKLVRTSFMARVPNGDAGEGSSVEVATADLICLLERFHSKNESGSFHIVAAIVQDSQERYGAAIAGYMMASAEEYASLFKLFEKMCQQFEDRITASPSKKATELMFSLLGNAIQMVEIKGAAA